MGNFGEALNQATTTTIDRLLAHLPQLLGAIEISLRHWRSVMFKEAFTGQFNGIAVAATTGIGVYIWSRSLALVGVITLAMVISMLAAGLAGALVPMLLRRVGQDPATASSIILTTVTDVVGFFSFLGIATLFVPLLEKSVG